MVPDSFGEIFADVYVGPFQQGRFPEDLVLVLPFLEVDRDGLAPPHFWPVCGSFHPHDWHLSSNSQQPPNDFSDLKGDFALILYIVGMVQSYFGFCDHRMLVCSRVLLDAIEYQVVPPALVQFPNLFIDFFDGILKLLNFVGCFGGFAIEIVDATELVSDLLNFLL